MELAELLKTPPSLTALPQSDTASGHEDFLSFYGLRQNPFGDSANSKFFYKTESHDVAYVRMMLAIKHDISLGLVTGVSGTGKTLLSQLLLKDIDQERYEPALILVSPNMSKAALLKEILRELSVPLDDPRASSSDMLHLLQNRIVELHENGRKLVLLIDECHFLSSESLHLIRTISNIEIPERKLSTCLLFGEERFLKRLEHPSYESLRNRMYLRGQLTPLSPYDCIQYVKFRLMTAGRLQDLFDPEAMVILHALSGGICRTVNKLCMLSLLDGFAKSAALITPDIVDACGNQL